jgi:hypothetical protein
MKLVTLVKVCAVITLPVAFTTTARAVLREAGLWRGSSAPARPGRALSMRQYLARAQCRQSNMLLVGTLKTG